MIPGLLFMIALGAGVVDPVSAALEHYRTVEAYQVTLRSTSNEAVDVIRYSYKRPGHVRMDFVAPHRGAVLIYDPLKAKARLWPLGPGFFSLTLDPGNRLIRSRTGQRIDRSDIGALLGNVQALQRGGETKVEASELSGHATLQVMVTGDKGKTAGKVHRYDLWLGRDTLLPFKVISRDNANRPIEEVVFEDLRIDPDLPVSIFSP